MFLNRGFVVIFAGVSDEANSRNKTGHALTGCCIRK